MPKNVKEFHMTYIYIYTCKCHIHKESRTFIQIVASDPVQVIEMVQHLLVGGSRHSRPIFVKVMVAKNRRTKGS